MKNRLVLAWVLCYCYPSTFGAAFPRSASLFPSSGFHSFSSYDHFGKFCYWIFSLVATFGVVSREMNTSLTKRFLMCILFPLLLSHHLFFVYKRMCFLLATVSQFGDPLLVQWLRHEVTAVVCPLRKKFLFSLNEIQQTWLKTTSAYSQTCRPLFRGSSKFLLSQDTEKDFLAPWIWEKARTYSMQSLTSRPTAFLPFSCLRTFTELLLDAHVFHLLQVAAHLDLNAAVGPAVSRTPGVKRWDRVRGIFSTSNSGHSFPRHFSEWSVVAVISDHLIMQLKTCVKFDFTSDITMWSDGMVLIFES